MKNSKISNYICKKCLKSFDRLSNYVRHINRITPCVVEKNMKEINEKQKEDLKKFIHKKYPTIADEVISTVIGDNTIIQNEKRYVCDYCSKGFSSSTHYKKHITDSCPRHLKFEQHSILDRLKKIERFKRENQDLKEKIYYETKNLPRYYVDGGKVVNVEKNYVNFYEQKNTRPFGNEILEHLTDDFMKKMIIDPEVGILNIIRIIHFNNAIPQNRNMFVKSKKFSMVEVYKRGGWKTVPKKDIFQNIIATKKDIMDEYFDRFKENEEIREKYKYKYEFFSKHLDKYITHLVFNTEYTNNLKKAKLIYDKICKHINILFLNNKKIEVIYTPENNLNTSLITNDDSFLECQSEDSYKIDDDDESEDYEKIVEIKDNEDMEYNFDDVESDEEEIPKKKSKT